MRHVLAAPPTVLAVDDDPVVRDCLGIVLEEHCQLVLAADGIEAIETLRSRSIDVVLLDLIMPRMNGFEALAHMRRDHARTPVIVLTAVADVPTVVASMKQGAWDYVAKPWQDDVLVALVHRAARDGRDEPGVLLVSDNIASLAPLQLALESQTRVLATNIARALRCEFLPTAIVLDCPSTRMTDTVRSLQDRFPKTPVIVMSHNGCALLGRSEAFRVDAIVGSSALDGALMELARLRVIDHAIALHTAVSAAVKFMVAHYGDPVTVRDVAEAANLSEGRLAHIFRDTTGLSVKDYMTRLRVSIARRLLAETTETLESIATRIGFADASTFSRTFKSVDGVAPGEFRRSRPSG